MKEKSQVLHHFVTAGKTVKQAIGCLQGPAIRGGTEIVAENIVQQFLWELQQPTRQETPFLSSRVWSFGANDNTASLSCDL